MASEVGVSRAALVSALRRGARGGLDHIEPEDGLVAAALRAFVDEGRVAHPDLALDIELFAQHVGSHVPRSVDGAQLAEELGKLHASDLYLACACAVGVPG